MAAPAFAVEGLPVTQHALTDKNAVIDIRALYPLTGDAKIDADIFATVNRIANGFRHEASETHNPHEAPYTLDVTYRIERNDAKMFAVVFNDLWDFHGAHPNLEFVTANYLRPGGWRVFLAELFDGKRALDEISKLATAELDRKLLGPDSLTDKDWIARGADAHWDNFQAFVLLPDALEIQFAPYQVAAYAAGPETARIPLARLHDYLRADPRAPVASFDCTRASTPNERAICSDVKLARLDRAVAESWSSEIRNEDNAKRKEGLRMSQRDWLSKRDNACGGAGDRVKCLTELYIQRLASLEMGE